MKGRILLRALSLVSLFLVLALAMVASAQTRRVGVNAGNKFRYSATASWSSNDPTDKPGPYVTRYNDTQWLEVNIAVIDGTNVVGQVTNHYKNGTEESSGGSIDIDSGNGSNMTYLIISAGLSAGDSLYTSSDFSGFINETVPRMYSGGFRDTNHVNATSFSGVSYTASNMYWDRLTGVLVDLSVEDTYQTANYTTSWSTGLQIISSDLWIVPEFSTWTPALLMLIGLTSAIIVIVRQRGAHRDTLRARLRTGSLSKRFKCSEIEESSRRLMLHAITINDIEACALETGCEHTMHGIGCSGPCVGAQSPVCAEWDKS